MKQQAPYIRAKDYDHEDVDAEFTSDGTLAIVANVLGTLTVFCLLMLAVLVLTQMPAEWLSWLVMRVGGA